MEEAWSTLEFLRSSGHLETDNPEVHIYSLGEEVNAEDAFFQQEGLENLTKIAMARFLERMGGPPRRTSWNRSAADLKDAVRPYFLAAGLPQGAPKAKAKGGAEAACEGRSQKARQLVPRRPST